MTPEHQLAAALREAHHQLAVLITVVASAKQFLPSEGLRAAADAHIAEARLAKDDAARILALHAKRTSLHSIAGGRQA